MTKAIVAELKKIRSDLDDLESNRKKQWNRAAVIYGEQPDQRGRGNTETTPKTRVCMILDVTRQTMDAKIREYGIEKPAKVEEPKVDTPKVKTGDKKPTAKKSTNAKPKADAKPTAKSGAKPKVKTESKTEVKTEAKPVARKKKVADAKPSDKKKKTSAVVDDGPDMAMDTPAENAPVSKRKKSDTKS